MGGFTKNVGGILGGAAGFMVGGPAGAAVGYGIGSSMDSANNQADAAQTSADQQAQAGQQSIAYQRESRDLARSDLAPFRNFATGSIYGSPSSGNPLMSQSAPQEMTGTINNAADMNRLYNQILGRNADPSGMQYYMGKSAADVARDMRGSKEYATLSSSGQLPTTETTQAPYSPGYDNNSPMALYSSLLDPQKQASYLQNNPMFQAALNQFGTKAKNTLGFGGLKGDMQNAITQNYMATGNQYIDQQMNRLLSPIQIGQASAAGQAAGALSTGANIGNTITDIGAARAAGTMGAANAQTAGTNALLSAGAQLAGAYYGAQR